MITSEGGLANSDEWLYIAMACSCDRRDYIVIVGCEVIIVGKDNCT